MSKNTFYENRMSSTQSTDRGDRTSSNSSNQYYRNQRRRRDYQQHQDHSNSQSSSKQNKFRHRWDNYRYRNVTTNYSHNNYRSRYNSNGKQNYHNNIEWSTRFSNQIHQNYNFYDFNTTDLERQNENFQQIGNEFEAKYTNFENQNDSILEKNNEDTSSRVTTEKIRNENEKVKGKNNYFSRDIENREKDEKISAISLVPISQLLEQQENVSVCPDRENIDERESAKQLQVNNEEKVNSNLPINPDRISKKLLNRIVRMDKIDIKNVINNPTSKFDTALKIHARKKLREELRKQLRNMNTNNANIEYDKNDSFFEPDGSIECAQIPETILNEISKSLGIELLSESEIQDENYLTNIDANSLLSTEGFVGLASPLLINQSLDSDIQKDKLIDKDIITADLEAIELKDVEVIKTDLNKIQNSKSSEVEINKMNDTNLKKKSKLSLSSSDSNDSDSSSDSESSSTNCSSNESNRSTRKRKLLEDNIITHFNTLILPNITGRDKHKFEKTKFVTKTDNLLFILEYLFKKTKGKNTISTHKKTRLKKDLKSADNTEGLKFLSAKIKELFEENKLKRKQTNAKVKINSSLKTPEENSSKKVDNSKRNQKQLEENSLNIDTNASSLKQKSPRKVQTKNNNYSPKSSKSETNFLSKSVNNKNSDVTLADTWNKQIIDISYNSKRRTQKKNSSPERTSKNNNKLIKESNSKSNKEEFIEHKEINDRIEQLLDDVEVRIATSATAKSDSDKYQEGHGSGMLIQSNFDDDANIYNGNDDEKITSNAVEMEHEKEINEAIVDYTNFTCLEKSNKQNNNKEDFYDITMNKESEKNVGENNEPQHRNRYENNRISEQKLDKVQRSWKSPGEKKCLQLSNEKLQGPSHENITVDSIVDINKISIPTQTSSDSNTHHRLSDLSNSFSSFNYSLDSQLEISSLIQQNKLSETVLDNLKNIDVKLMELHKRKIYIEEMILRLQKDKMSLDLTAMQLQNEKFFIINSALNNDKNNSYLTSSQLLPGYCVKSESTNITSSSDLNSINLLSNRFSKQSQSPEQNLNNSSQFKRKTNEHSNSMNKKINTKKSYHETRRSRFDRDRNGEIVEDVNFPKIIQSKSNSPKLCDPKINNKLTEESRFCEQSNSQMVISETSVDEIDNSSGNLYSNNEQSKSKNVKEHFHSRNIETFESSEICINEKTDMKEKKNLNEQQMKNVSNLNVNDIGNGSFENLKSPITKMRIVENFVVAASEDGNIYKFCLKTRKLISKFSKHTEAITEIFIDEYLSIYTTSLDGYLKKTSLENFGLELQSKDLQEPLQCLDLQWNIAFIGSRWGNVFTYSTKVNKLSEVLLCSVGSSIMALKATKEGARKILIVSSKGNQINFRDAASGLLLRTIHVPETLSICSILLDGDLLYCGSNKNEIRTYNFITGANGEIFRCGNGAVSMKLYKRKLLFIGCYDGFVYVLDKVTGSQIGRFPGAGKMILALDIFNEKIITSSKYNCMHIRDIPKYISVLVILDC